MAETYRTFTIMCVSKINNYFPILIMNVNNQFLLMTTFKKIFKTSYGQVDLEQYCWDPQNSWYLQNFEEEFGHLYKERQPAYF